MEGVVQHDDACTLGEAVSLRNCWERAAAWSGRWIGRVDGRWCGITSRIRRWVIFIVARWLHAFL